VNKLFWMFDWYSGYSSYSRSSIEVGLWVGNCQEQHARYHSDIFIFISLELARRSVNCKTKSFECSFVFW